MDSIVTSPQTQLVISYVTVVVLQRLKDSPACKWLSQNTVNLNRAIGVIVAVLSSVGFTFVHTGTMVEGGTITITYPPNVLHVLLELFVRIIYSWVTQQVTYHGYIKRQFPATPPPS